MLLDSAAIRRATGLSQQKFGAALGVSKATIENIELGRAPISPERWHSRSARLPELFRGQSRATQDRVILTANRIRRNHGSTGENISLMMRQIEELSKMARDHLFVLLEAAARDTPGLRGSPGLHRSHIFRQRDAGVQQIHFRAER